MIRALLSVIALGGVATLGAAGYWWGEFAYRPVPVVRPTAESAAWLAHRWVGDKLPDAQYEALARRLQENGIKQGYAHVGPLEADGGLLPEKHRYSRQLLAAFRRLAPGVRLLAWIGQAEKVGGGPLDLGNPATRARIGATARELLAEGFDGIHVNIEPIYNGDQRWVSVLAVLRGITAAERKLLSIAGDDVEPFPGANRLVSMVTPRGGLWSVPYYMQIAWHVDEIALMAYDTAAPWGWVYAKIVEWETRTLAAELPSTVRLLVGLPTYKERRWSFHPEAENLTSGLTGVRRALASLRNDDREIGVAIYAEWTTDEGDWKKLRELWMNQR